jgi:hypothetical protein
MTRSHSRTRLSRLGARLLAPAVLVGSTFLAAPRAADAGLLSGLLGGGASAPAKEAVVHLGTGASTSSVLSLLNVLGWRVVDVASATLWVVAPQGPSAASLSLVVGLVGSLTGVLGVEENVLFTLDDPYEGKQSQMPMFSDDFTFASVREQPAMGAIDWAAATPGAAPAPVVAVIDGGFDLGHESLPAASVAWAHDAIDGDTDPTDRGDGVDGDDDGRVDGGLGHGTAVAGLVLAVAPSARVAAVRALDDEGDGSTATVAAAIDHATSMGASVIHLSLGSSQPSGIVEHFLHFARQQGIVVVAAAGNGAGGPVTYPGFSTKVVCVAGVSAGGTPDPESSRGSAVDVSAPSVDVVAPHPLASDAYGTWQGTSVAAPFFSGAVAQCLVGRPGSTADAEAQALLSLATPFPAGVTGYGAGRLDLRAALER